MTREFHADSSRMHFRERRSRPRVRLCCPVRLIRPGRNQSLQSITEDLSCEGFYCRTEERFSLDETLECELLLPNLLNRKGGCTRIQCEVRVIRVVEDPLGLHHGVGCRVSRYKVSREGSDSDSPEESMDVLTLLTSQA